MRKERADTHTPRADNLRNFKPFQAWLQERRMSYEQWELRQAKPQRADSHVAVLRAKLELVDAQTRRR